MTHYSRLKHFPKKKDVLSGKFDSQKLLGRYHSLYMGHSLVKTERERSASGGLGTALGCLLLEQEVDVILCGDIDYQQKMQPRFCAIQDKARVIHKAGSKYVYFSWQSVYDVLKENKDKSMAVIVQPCFVPMLRKLQKRDFPNIKYIISFFCGYNMNFDATEYMLKKAGVQSDEVKEIQYRGGPYPGGFTVIRKNGETIEFGKEAYEALNLMFLRRGCGQCARYTGEEADIALGDAWLKDQRDMNVIISRTNAGQKLLGRSLEDSRIALYDLEAADLIKMHWHNIKYKKHGHSLGMRIIVKLLNQWIPRSLIPFRMLSKISKLRRKMKIGILISNWHQIKTEQLGRNRE